MGYYQGDHYRSRRFAGDYYRGDPGFLSGIGHFFSGIARKAINLIPGVGPVIGTALELRSKLRHVGVPTPTGGPPVISDMIAATERGMMNGGRNPNNLPGFPNAPGGLITQSPMGTPVHPAAIAMEIAQMQRHTHPNKSTYVTRGGGTSRWGVGLQVHPKGTEAVTSRRMNVGNARALRRALRRARGFAKLAHKVLRVTHQFKGKGFGRARSRKR